MDLIKVGLPIGFSPECMRLELLLLHKEKHCGQQQKGSHSYSGIVPDWEQIVMNLLY